VSVSPVEGQRDIKKVDIIRLVSTMENESPRSYRPITVFLDSLTTLRSFLRHTRSFVFHGTL
jgi:hypothetical protein